MEERQYLDLISRILETGSFETGRNGNTKSVFGHTMRFSLRDGALPLLTTKQVAWKTCFKELMWFIRGDTNNELLKSQGVHIWDANGTREFLDSRGLTDYTEDELGPIYGWQWRRFNQTYTNDAIKQDYVYDMKQSGYDRCCVETLLQERETPGVDQLQQIIDALKDPEQRTSRRLVMSAWNPCQLDEMALPPCHILCQFNVRNGKHLSCAMYQRSGDVGLGVPFNIASYSFLTHILAKHCGLEAEEFVYFLGNAHIYEQHIEPLSKQMNNVPYTFPKIEIKEQRENIEDYCVDDIVWKSEYKHHPAIKMEMLA
jgi:thymidylate synthase